MTPALSLAFLPASDSPPALPITWHGRLVFTEEHVVSILESLRFGGISRDRSANGVLGLRYAIDAGKALRHACDACPALAREVDAAEAEGRARLRVEGVGGGAHVDVGSDGETVAGPVVLDSTTRSGVVGGRSGEAEHEGGEHRHAVQPVIAEARAQEAMTPQAPATWREVTARSAALDVAAPRVAEPARSKRASEATDDGAPDWERIREEAAGYAPGPYGWVLYQEDHLAHSGENFPALSPFSLYTIERFFLSGKRWLLWMAGRGFSKSTLTARIATALGFGVQRRAAPGPAWVCPIVSVLPVDADRRLEDIQQILLHVYRQEVKPVKSMIAATDGTGCAIAWVSSASTIGNVSGPSSFAALMDEEEKILNKRAGGIVGSLAFTFRSRPRTYGMRVSSAMTTADTLAGDCERGQTLTNYVVTLGPFVDAAVAGLLAVAAWEEAGIATGKANPEAANAIRYHALSLTAESWQIPTWLGHPSIGIPTDAEGRPMPVPWGPGDAAIATRIEAEAVPEKARDGLPPWRYWLRECCSVPTGDEAWETAGEWAVLGEEHRNAEMMTEDRWDGR